MGCLFFSPPPPQTALSSFFQETNIPGHHHQMVSGAEPTVARRTCGRVVAEALVPFRSPFETDSGAKQSQLRGVNYNSIINEPDLEFSTMPMTFCYWLLVTIESFVDLLCFSFLRKPELSAPSLEPLYTL